MGMWIAIIIVLFVLGSMMALKPSGIDQRLDKLRMTARRLQLNPKLVACPDWVRGRDGEYGRGMLGQYCLVIDEVTLPHTRYHVIDGHLRPDKSLDAAGMPINTSLDHVALALPATIEPFVKAVWSKSNSIVVYWEDIAYVRPLTNPHYQAALIEPDLLVLKSQLRQWAEQMQQGSQSDRSIIFG